MKKNLRKVYRSVVCLILLAICYYFSVVKTDLAQNIHDAFNKNIGRIMSVVLGVISLGSGLRGWRFWGIRSSIRETKYGDIINAIIMTCVGVMGILIGLGLCS